MENKVNISTYRAQRVLDNKWIEGNYLYLKRFEGEHLIVPIYWRGTITNTREIKPETLAISFPDMLDANGNQIFASLNPNGQGGDLIKSTWWMGKDEPQNLMIAIYNHFGFDLKFKLESNISATPFKNMTTENVHKNFEVIGINT